MSMIVQLIQDERQLLFTIQNMVDAKRRLKEAPQTDEIKRLTKETEEAIDSSITLVSKNNALLVEVMLTVTPLADFMPPDAKDKLTAPLFNAPLPTTEEEWKRFLEGK